jgi:transcriptional regulator with XRE-family HTH domain
LVPEDATEIGGGVKAAGSAAGATLTEVAKRTGMERPNLSRLENEAESNPTIATLTRYAEALGKRLFIALADGEARR